MLTVNLICVGSLKERYWKDACAEYAKRLSVFCRLNIIEIEESCLPDRPSEQQIKQALDLEGKRILSRAAGLIVPLCIEGKQEPSTALAKRLQNWTLEGVSTVSFIIGGSFGLSDEVKKAGRQKLSMSEMTFPHQLARVMLLEQIYRCFMIQSNTKYHK